MTAMGLGSSGARTVLVALVVLVTASDADARRTPASLVLVIQVPDGVPAGWKARIEQSALGATAKIRGLSWMAPPQVSLDETRMLLGCRHWNAGCVAKLGATLGAQRVLFLSIDTSRAQRPLSRLTDVSVDKPGVGESSEIDLGVVDEVAYAAIHAQVLARINLTTNCVWIVRSEPRGAQVLLDGTVVGTTPMTHTELPPGPHKIELRLKGHVPHQQSLMFGKGQTRLLQAALRVQPAAPVTSVTPNSKKTNPPQRATSSESTTEGPSPTPILPLVEPVPADAPSSPILAYVGLGLGGTAVLAGGALYAAHLVLAQPVIQAQQEFESGHPVTRMTQVEYERTSAILMPLYFGAVGSALTGVAMATGGGLMWMLSASEAADVPASIEGARSN